MKTKGLFIVLWLSAVCGFSQFANDWIDYNQQYFRIHVAEDGLYRIDASDLSDAGVPISEVAAGRFQLFHRGEEVAIITNSNTEGFINYLEFYGERNDGTSDSMMYLASDAQPHTYYNLFSDTSVYFLTWKLQSAQGKRMSFSSDQNNSGLTASSSNDRELLQLQTSDYRSGERHGSLDQILTAEFDYGEGWSGGNINKNQTRTFTLDLSDAITSGSVPELEVLFFGVNNLEHLVEVSAGPNGSSQRVLGQSSFESQNTAIFNSSLNWTDVSVDGKVLVNVIALGVNGQAERVAVGYVKCNFPKKYSFEDTAMQKSFRIKSTGSQKGYAKVPTNVASSLRVFDVTETPLRIAATAFSDRLEFVFPNAIVDRQFLVVQSPRSVGSIERVVFKKPDLQSSDYLIVSHPALDVQVAGVNPVTEYISYRRSVEGGSFDVFYMDISQIYDQFGYGEKSPVAIRNYVQYAVGVGIPKHLFLIGKGTTLDYKYYRQNPATSTLVHYIPTFGFPGSDALFSVNIVNGNQEPLLSTGRLNAYTNEDVRAYLAKVKEMESIEYNELWRKNLVNLSGGTSLTERNSFANHINTFKNKAESDYLGGKASNFNKSNSDAVQLINIAGEINSGVSLVTFFGHSTGETSDIEIGRVSPENNVFGYSNRNKYPIFLINGCEAGKIFRNTSGLPESLTFGEDWLHTPNLGAIGFIANSDYALPFGLKRWSDLFYEEAFNIDTAFARSVGEIIVSVNKQYFNTFQADILDRAQVYQTVYQGDPAIKVFGADKPDYEIHSEELYADAFEQDRVLANQDSFSIQIPIRNYGRSVNDSLEVKILRTLGDGSTESIESVFTRVLRHDTLSFVLYNDPQKVNEGSNTFVVNIDPNDLTPELNEINNSASFELFIPKGNTINLFPINFGTVSESSVEFVWQSANPFAKNRSYVLEVDTTDRFNSPAFMQKSFPGDLLLKYVADYSAYPDSTTFYWRTRYLNPVGNEDTTWVNSSFTLTPAAATTGWGQIHKGQLKEATKEGVSYNPSIERWSFAETNTPIEVRTHGVGSLSDYSDYLVSIDGVNFLATSNTIDPICKKSNSINVVLFGRENAQPYSPFTGDTDVFNDLICGRRPQMIHNLNETDVLGPNRYLDSLITIMEDRDMILVFSFDSVAFSNWDAQVLNSLASIGISGTTISGLTDGQPVIFLGRKGDAEGTAVEVVENGTGIPLKEQTIDLANSVTGKFNTGSIISPRIGPAKAWGSLTYTIDDEPGDNVSFDVLGITSAGESQSVFSSARFNELDISQISALQYPYLQLLVNFSDEINQTPPQLNGWGVNYELPPEGLLNLDSLLPQEVQEGEDFVEEFNFISLSDRIFEDSVLIEYLTTNLQSGVIASKSFLAAPPDSNDSIAIELRIPTRGKVGQNNLLVRLSAIETEQYQVNNLLNINEAFEVVPDETNPVLDVTFDGAYILDGDIVSPNPSIAIHFSDENEFLFKGDTVGIVLEVQRPCEGCVYERVNFTSPDISYSVAGDSQDFEINYMPGPLEDGIHKLRVQGEDESGNSSGVSPYEISFEVINESTVTFFYPYPNPFSTSTRFVFTLTGSTIPDQIKIQIMTISGRVVREINATEIGPLKIGQNMTDYAWDGRDEFGDQLANGVYLYKVFIRQGGERIKHRNTTADRAFKNGFGKIYILR